MKSPTVAAISHAFPRLHLPRKTSADASPVRLSPARSAKKTQPLSDCVFFKWRDGLRVELDCATLALSGFCVAKIPFASHPPVPQKNATPIGLRLFQVAGWTSRRIGLRCACPVGFLRCKNPVRLSPARSAKKRNPYRIASFSSGGMDFASNWTALRLPCRVFALQKSRSPLARPLRKKTQPLSDCVFFKWRDGLRVELDCAALALSGFCVAKIRSSSKIVG